MDYRCDPWTAGLSMVNGVIQGLLGVIYGNRMILILLVYKQFKFSHHFSQMMVEFDHDNESNHVTEMPI